MNAVNARLGLTAAPGVRPHYGDQDPGGPQKLDVAAIAAKFAELKSSDKGLTSDEAKARLAKDGPNAIVAKEEPLWHKLFGYFWGPIPWMIEAAGADLARKTGLGRLRGRLRPADLQRRGRLLAGREGRERARGSTQGPRSKGQGSARREVGQHRRS